MEVRVKLESLAECIIGIDQYIELINECTKHSKFIVSKSNEGWDDPKFEEFKETMESTEVMLARLAETLNETRTRILEKNEDVTRYLS